MDARNWGRFEQEKEIRKLQKYICSKYMFGHKFCPQIWRTQQYVQAWRKKLTLELFYGPEALHIKRPDYHWEEFGGPQVRLMLNNLKVLKDLKLLERKSKTCI